MTKAKRTNEERIVARIARVRASYEKARSDKSKSADYKYLESVLAAHDYFDERNLLDSLTEIAPCALMTSVRSGQHPIRTIIDSSCADVDPRTKSRWTRALQFAILRSIAPDDLIRFLRATMALRDALTWRAR
ncbi:hypothetical protein ABH999_004382 [Bradyrhizobium yuanmingense]|uniref:hypothetical protein n=1 Tax=Bradyrhizobium yuanmingense TaxID=108015 RepID=UPI0035191A35